MPYFLSPENLKIGQTLEIDGEEAVHLLFSRRLKVGEKLKLQGPDEKRFICRVVAVGKRDLKILAEEAAVVPLEPKVSVVLYQAVVNQTALDLIFQKTTELQAEKIVLFNSQNTANLLSRQKFEEKKHHWEKVLLEAAKQCERVRPPKLLFYGDSTEAVVDMKTLDKVILLNPQSPKRFNDMENERLNTLGLVVGPEGGFTREEIDQILSLQQSVGLSLGEVLLRAETAAIAALALAQNLK